MSHPLADHYFLTLLSFDWQTAFLAIKSWFGLVLWSIFQVPANLPTGSLDRKRRVSLFQLRKYFSPLQSIFSHTICRRFWCFHGPRIRMWAAGLAWACRDGHKFQRIGFCQLFLMLRLRVRLVSLWTLFKAYLRSICPRLWSYPLKFRHFEGPTNIEKLSSS